MYDVWVMTSLKNNRRIAECSSLTEAREVITPKHRKEYVYILKWAPTPQTSTTSTHPRSTAPATHSTTDRFGPLQGQCPSSRSAASLLISRQAVYVWGCLCGRVHTNDMRESVRKVLRSQ